MITVNDFEDFARNRLPRAVFDHVSGGADDERSLNDNVNSFNRYRIRPRVLRDVSHVNLSTTVLGRNVPCPIGIAPTAIHQLASIDSELATARAASSFGTIMILSSFASSSIEEVAASHHYGGYLWFQVYFFKDRNLTANLIRRADKAGYHAIVLTADTPYTGRKLRDERVGGFHPDVRCPNIDAGSSTKSYGSLNSSISPCVTWADVHWMKTLTSLPIIIKGVISAQNAVEAAANGVNGIIVSNHGGRQLDGVPASIDVLAEVLSATEGSKLEVYIDGGFRLGTDILKALAMGARAVFIGRPVWWGLVYHGEEGVGNVLQILKDELSSAMALCGCSSVCDLNPAMIVQGPQMSANL